MCVTCFHMQEYDMCIHLLTYFKYPYVILLNIQNNSVENSRHASVPTLAGRQSLPQAWNISLTAVLGT